LPVFSVPPARIPLCVCILSALIPSPRFCLSASCSTFQFPGIPVAPSQPSSHSFLRCPVILPIPAFHTPRAGLPAHYLAVSLFEFNHSVNVSPRVAGGKWRASGFFLMRCCVASRRLHPFPKSTQTRPGMSSIQTVATDNGQLLRRCATTPNATYALRLYLPPSGLSARLECTSTPQSRQAAELLMERYPDSR
jgi:hypothetical protein